MKINTPSGGFLIARDFKAELKEKAIYLRPKVSYLVFKSKQEQAITYSIVG